MNAAAEAEAAREADAARLETEAAAAKQKDKAQEEYEKALRDLQKKSRTTTRTTTRAPARRSSGGAAGGIARAALDQLIPGVQVKGYMTRMGAMTLNRDRFDWDAIDGNDFWLPDSAAAPEWEAYLQKLRKDHNSVGAIIEIVGRRVPAGLGAPIYGKLDTDLAAAMMSINAVKGVEIGEGMSAAMLTGELNADEISMGPEGPVYSSNHAGGILGGISTGQDIVVRFAVKPTSSILTTRKTITKSGEDTEIITKGRHDPCVGIRAVPVGEAMMACVLLDHMLLHRGQVGENQGHIG
jgi:chorismate synthase